MFSCVFRYAMDIKNPKFLLLLLVLNIMFISCTKEVDFDQASDLEISPVLESSLIFFDESINNFLDPGTEISFEDFVIIDFFNNDFAVDNLVKTEFVFETQNTINRDFELQIDFFDRESQLQHTFTVTENASTANEDVVTTHIEVFEDATLDAFKNSSVLVFRLTMLPGNAVNEDTPGRISLKSKAIFYFNIEG